MPYEPTKWVNMLKDGEEVIQKGTPLTADNLNKIEHQLEVVTKEADKVEGQSVQIIAVKEALVPLVGIPQQLNDYQLEREKGLPGGYVPIGEDGLIPGSFIPSSFKEIKVVANIAERNALIVFEGLRVHVTDATADTTVASGWAEYLHNGTTWVKVSEKDSIDVVVNWNNITGKPTTFTPSTHTHTIAQVTGLQTELNAKETPAAAKIKADTAEANAKTYTDNKAKYGGKFEWQYNAATNSLDLVVVA